MSIYGDIKSVVVKFIQIYPKIWERVLPEPEVPSLSPDAIWAKDQAQKWRNTWMWVSVVCFLYALIGLGIFQRPLGRKWSFLDFAVPDLLICLLTGYLVLCVPTVKISPWRLARCGVICIWILFFVPTFICRLSDLLNAIHLGPDISWLCFINPMQEIKLNILVLIAMTFLNALLVYKAKKVKAISGTVS